MPKIRIPKLPSDHWREIRESLTTRIDININNYGNNENKLDFFAGFANNYIENKNILILQFNILILSIVVNSIILMLYKYNKQLTKCIIIINLITFLMLLICEQINLIFFYMLYEIINILIYSLLGLNSPKLLYFKGSVIYFLMGFFGSILFISGIICNITSNVFISECLILLSLFMKFGSFPLYFWVIPVYTNISNINFMLFISLLKLNNIILINTYMLKFISYLEDLKYLFICFILGSIIGGSFILAKQTTIKGFLAGSSIINVGIITYGLYNSIYYYTCLNNHVLAIKNFIYVYSYLNTYLLLNIFIFTLWYFLIKGDYVKNKILGKYNTNKVYIQNLYYPLIYFKDNYLIISLWILGGFPPFLLFIFKFYILYLSIYINNIYLLTILLISLNTIALYGYVKVLSSLLIKLKYKK